MNNRRHVGLILLLSGILAACAGATIQPVDERLRVIREAADQIEFRDRSKVAQVLGASVIQPSSLANSPGATMHAPVFGENSRVQIIFYPAQQGARDRARIEVVLDANRANCLTGSAVVNEFGEPTRISHIPPWIRPSANMSYHYIGRFARAGEVVLISEASGCIVEILLAY